MSAVNSILRSIVPAGLRAKVRSMHREFVFRRAMREYLASPEAITRAGNTLASDLIYGWGNESWSALGEYLAGCIEHAAKTDGPILECGSGLSTLLVGAVAKQRGVKHVVLEHHPEWARRVQSYIDRYRLDNVTLHAASIKDFGKYAWYDAPLNGDRFAMVICDGPPGNTKGGRYGLASVWGKLAAGCSIFLDDAAREDEQAIAKRWAKELNATSEIIGTDKPYIKLTIKENR